jgi:type II secretory pathway pseudopilin PulG
MTDGRVVLPALVLLQLLIDMVLHQDIVVAEMQQQQQQQQAAGAAAQQQHQRQQLYVSPDSCTYADNGRSGDSITGEAAAPRNKSSSSSISSISKTDTTPASTFTCFGSPDAVGQAAAAAQAGTKLAGLSCDSKSADGSYIMRLLRNATVEQLQLVLMWDVDDWCNYWRVSCHDTLNSTSS